MWSKVDSCIGEVWLDVTDCRGRVFARDFTVRKDPGSGPGWFVYGTGLPGIGRDHYGGNIVKMVAVPSPIRKWHPHYNGRALYGWRLKRDAKALADELNKSSSRLGLANVGTVVHCAPGYITIRERRLPSGALVAVMVDPNDSSHGVVTITAPNNAFTNKVFSGSTSSAVRKMGWACKSAEKAWSSDGKTKG